MKAGRAAEAVREIEAVLASPWRSAETFATAAIAYRRNGDAERAAAAEAQAIALHPRAIRQ